MAKKILSYTAAEIDHRLSLAHEHSNKSTLDSITSAKVSEWNGKQDKLIAGANITIDPDTNVISATGELSSAAWGNITGTLTDQTDLKSALDAKQDTLIAGAGITIAADGKTISATGGGGSSTWGDIMGNIADQLDLKEELDAKQNTITDVPADSTNGKFVYSVSQTNGQIAVVSKGMDAFATGGTVSDDAYYLHGGSENSPINKLKYLNVWNYIKDKLSTFFGMTDNNQPICSGTSDRLTIVKVAALPASPDPNVIYLISE